MTSQVPSKSQSDSGLRNQLSKYFGGLLGIFLIWTVALVTYTLIQQHGCSHIIWWQQRDQVSCSQTSVPPKFKEKEKEIRPGKTDKSNSPQVPDDNGIGEDPPDIIPPDPEKVKSAGCSAQTAVVIGALVTIGSSALLVPPPVAFVAGSVAATGLCWIIDQVN